MIFENIVKISEDKDFKALNKKRWSNKEIQWIMSELGLKLEAIYEKLKDAYVKILTEELYNKIKQVKDFKALMEKHDVENEEQFIFEGLLSSNIKKNSEERSQDCNRV